jgi:SAM-dependent methyltransferase
MEVLVKASRTAPLLALALALAAPACGPAGAPPRRPPASAPAAGSASAPAPRPLEQLRREARAVEPLVYTDLARAFLRATAGLPSITPRTVWHDAGKTKFYPDAQARALPDARRRVLRSRTLGEEYYYTTKYGTPLAYSRPLDLLARAGLRDVAGARVFDFGYGGIGHLRLLAGLGAEVTGVDVDPLLPALYAAPGDQGPVAGPGGRTGRVTLVDGRWPADADVARAVGDGYDLVISKNTLKRGYVHPEQPVEERKRIRLGVDDAAFVRTLFRIVKPGGRVLIYNICPAPAPPGTPYIPWADGRSPFTRETWAAAGFRVAAFDRDDTAAARAMGHALEWDRGEDRMDLEHGLFAWYTLLEKPAESAPQAPRLTLRPPLSAEPIVVLSITAQALVVAVRAGAAAPQVVGTIARRPGKPPYDYGTLNRALAKIVRTRWPDPAKRPAESQQITISAAPDTSYDTLVQVMDAARAVRPGPGVTDTGRVLFPDVVLGVAP